MVCRWGQLAILDILRKAHGLGLMVVGVSMERCEWPLSKPGRDRKRYGVAEHRGVALLAPRVAVAIAKGEIRRDWYEEKNRWPLDLFSN